MQGAGPFITNLGIRFEEARDGLATAYLPPGRRRRWAARRRNNESRPAGRRPVPV